MSDRPRAREEACGESGCLCGRCRPSIGRGRPVTGRLRRLPVRPCAARRAHERFAAFSAVRVAARAFLAVLANGRLRPALDATLTCRRAERAALPTLRFALRTADLAFTRADALRALDLTPYRRLLARDFAPYEPLLAALASSERRAAFFGFLPRCHDCFSRKFRRQSGRRRMPRPGFTLGLCPVHCQREKGGNLVERKGIEPSTFALRTRRSPS